MTDSEKIAWLFVGLFGGFVTLALLWLRRTAKIMKECVEGRERTVKANTALADTQKYLAAAREELCKIRGLSQTRNEPPVIAKT